ncbi:LysR family transcriptional regulator [Aliamphritea spongicola]|uniref:LysR family transcriptional regulator n=1 Tax=Aliamphritea spongicola TaxID=707589 RepID=UPI00196B6547|nr:LysR family transcriptional regulator [Aliamphritea spongicola]MBN3561114.1 LysR family transcriptional regulator [Aliamphritea spongicola]
MRNITLKQLRAFVAVAHTRSFTEACARVHLSQPALSIAIKNLEEEVGGELLARTTRTLALTPEGEEFYPVAERMLLDWDNALDDLQQRFALKRGRIVIGAMPSFASSLLPALLKPFRNEFPHIAVTVQDVVAESVVDLIREGRIEIGFSFDPGEAEDLNFTPLFRDNFVAIVDRHHPLASAETIDWKDLLADHFISLQKPSSMRQLLTDSLAEHGMQLIPELESHQLVTVGRMVSAGLGVSAVPSVCIQQMQEMSVVCKPLQAPQISRPVGIITRKRYPLSSAARQFLDIVGQQESYFPEGL